MSKWWFEDHKYDDTKNKTYSKGSGSRSWLTKLGGYYSDYNYWKPKKDKNETYQDLLNQLQNSANIVGDAEVGSIKVHWSNGTNMNVVSEDNTRDIYLSPDNLVTDNEVSEEVLDAMTGKVYLASTLRDTVDPSEYKRANNARKSDSSSNKNAVKIWESLETSIARSKVLEDWAGFSPYIAGDAERSSASKKEVQDYINASEKNPSANAASLAISWNILNSHDPVDVPDVYLPCMEAAASFMENEIPADKRFGGCVDLANKIHSILKEAGAKEEKAPGDKPGMPGVCDGTLLGEVVKNQTDVELAEQEAEKGSEDDKSSEEKRNPFHCPPPDGMDDSGKKYEIIPVNVGAGGRDAYAGILRSHVSEIRSIQSSLMFRNTSEKLNSYGHRTGDIDENNLYKVFMNDDRVMLRTDVQNKKDIAICLLVDESGSMSGRIEEARKVAIIIGESLKSVDGIECSIYGHSAQEGSYHGVTIREYYTPRHRDMSRCMGMAGRSENLDSWAIMHTANLFYRDYSECDRKIMFVISDGQPAGGGYGGSPAYKHMRSVSAACEKKGVEVYGVGIENAYGNEIGVRMYGENRFVVLKDIKSSLGIMTRFIRQVAMKQ